MWPAKGVSGPIKGVSGPFKGVSGPIRGLAVGMYVQTGGWTENFSLFYRTLSLVEAAT